jgi:ABC-2 type transport system permease protein
MLAYWTLVRRELGAHFFSWAGYVVIAMVLFLVGYSFAALLMVLNAEAIDRPITEVFFSSYYFWMILLICAPVITMRSFALEKFTGTFETLMTAPVGDLQVVLAKFTGAMLFYLVMWLPLLFCLLVVRHYSNDPSVVTVGSLASTFLGIVLLGALYLALGCFCSALTRSQIIAAITSFSLGLSLFFLSYLATTFSTRPGWTSRFFTQVGLVDHLQDFAAGVVDTRPVVFCLSLTVFFLFLALKAVEARRWR